MAFCRICLNKRPQKDLTQLLINKNSKTLQSYTHIMMFCLDIQVEQNSTVSTKLCIKCYRNIVTYYKFKTLALKNDAYLKSLDVKTEVFYDDDNLKKENCEQESLCTREFRKEDDTNKEGGVPISTDEFEVKLELNDDRSVIADSPVHGCISGSDDEYLGSIKKIKYEYIEEAKEVSIKKSKSETKENAKKKIEKKHKRVKPKPKPKKEMCAECGKTVNNLKKHKYTTHQRKCLKCNLCDQMFSDNSTRNRHNRIRHLGIKETCNICNKTVAHLSLHRRIVHNKESLPHKCLECGSRFISKSSLDNHNRIHSNEKPFSCPECDRSFVCNSLLQEHIRGVHRKEKPYLCQVCSKSFFRKRGLERHMSCHSNDKSHECPKCGKFYKTADTLRSHLGTHVEENNFACGVCQQTFKKRRYLVNHMLSHSRIKRYECQYCGMKFHRSDHRKQHEYTVHQKHLVTSDATGATSFYVTH